MRELTKKEIAIIQQVVKEEIVYTIKHMADNPWDYFDLDQTPSNIDEYWDKVSVSALETGFSLINTKA